MARILSRGYLRVYERPAISVQKVIDCASRSTICPSDLAPLVNSSKSAEELSANARQTTMAAIHVRFIARSFRLGSPGWLARGRL